MLFFLFLFFSYFSSSRAELLKNKKKIIVFVQKNKTTTPTAGGRVFKHRDVKTEKNLHTLQLILNNITIKCIGSKNEKYFPKETITQKCFKIFGFSYSFSTVFSFLSSLLF